MGTLLLNGPGLEQAGIFFFLFLHALQTVRLVKHAFFHCKVPQKAVQ
jgi:hypothetical protein